MTEIDGWPWRVEDGEIVDAEGCYVGPSEAIGELELMRTAIERVRELCESRRAVTSDGGRTDIDTVWPSEILDALAAPTEERS